MNSATNISPQRPLVPPKPDKNKINFSPPVECKLSSGTQVNCHGLDLDNRKSTQNGQDPRHAEALAKSQSAPSVPPHSGKHNNSPSGHWEPQSPLSNPHQKLSISPLKPALPPKPVSNPVTSPPRKPVVCPNPRPPSGSTQVFSRSGNSVSIANSILANRGRHSLDDSVNVNSHPTTSTRKITDGFFSDPETPKSLGVIRRDLGSYSRDRSFNKSTSEPVSPRPIFNNNPRPFSSVFTFPSPDTNINSPGFPSTHIRKPSEIRAKSASLGRNVTPPTSIGGFFSSKAATLSRILPLDLHLGKLSTAKSKSQQPMQDHITSPIQNFGRKISFSTNSPIPPPPPPRLKKKLSPVNSLSPVPSMSPTSPAPVFSPNNPFMTSVQEEPAIYAEVDKEKKWAQRKLKQDTVDKDLSKSVYDVDEACIHTEQTSKDIQASLVISISPGDKNKSVDFQSHVVEPSSRIKNYNTSSQSNINMQESKSKGKKAENGTGNSWLEQYLPEPVVSKNNPFKSAQDEMIFEDSSADKLHATVNPTKAVTDKLNEKVKQDVKSRSVPIYATIEDPKISVKQSETLVENDSFLFKLTHSLEENIEQHSEKNLNVLPTSIKAPKYQTDRKSDTPNMSIVEALNVTYQSISNFPAVDFKENRNATTLKEHHPFENEVKANINTDKNESSDEIRGEILDPDTILHSVDAKIQSAVSLLSNLSGNSSPVPSKDPLPTSSHLPIITGNFESLSISEVDLTKKSSVHDSNSLLKNQTTSSDITLSSLQSDPNGERSVKELAELLSPIENFQRRRSWNCSGDSSSPCESSSSSLGNIRDRAFTYSSEKTVPGWADDGDISAGALGDVESSDAQIPYSSTEDMGSAGSISRKNKRGWLFSSFGKGGSSSSSSNGNQKATPKSRHKEKTKSLAVDSNVKFNSLGRFGRQVSDSVLTTALISGPISFRDEPSQPKSSQSHPTVQFSSDVIDSPIYRYRYSGGSISEAGETESIDRRDDCEKGDNESVGSASSANAILGGFEDILSELSPKDKKSFYVAREILTSEQTFVDVLDLLTVEFPNAIKEAEEIHRQPVIPPHDIDGILAGLSNLKRVNQELLVDLQNRIKSWRANPKLADIIVKKGPFLKLYAHYIKNFEKTIKHLDGCCERYPLFKKVLLDFEMSDRCQKLGLKHYMLKPVQRMPQYRLLLEDYLKHLEADSGDYQDSIKAIAIVRDVAEHANEAIRLQVNAEKLMNLQSRLIGCVIMKADRQLMKEGELMKVCRKGLQPRFFALMNDCLMSMTYNVGGGSDLKKSYEIPLAGIRVCLTAIEDHPNEFSVISVTRSFNLVAKSPKEREEWMKALNNAIHFNIKKRTCTTPDQEIGFQLGKVAPVWIQDARVTMCQICTAEFTVTFRRHHCRACGKVVCGHCSGNQAPLQYLKNDSARVCDECYQFLLEEFDRESRDNNSDGLETSRETIRTRFKKVTPNVSKRASKLKKSVPSRLEVHANNSGSRISNYLHCRERKAWKRHWFVLMERVLYIYAASEDILALRSIPVLGWDVDYEQSESMEGGNSESVFKLTHTGQNTLLFQAENPHIAERWVAAMKEATVLT